MEDYITLTQASGTRMYVKPSDIARLDGIGETRTSVLLKSGGKLIAREKKSTIERKILEGVSDASI